MHLVDLPPSEQQLHERLPSGWGGRWYGVMPAVVLDVRDPDNQGRVQVTLPWSVDGGGARYEAWARLATMMGGNNRGSWFVPDVDDEVLVAFEHGDPRRPYVLGALWNGRDRAPAAMDGAGRNDKKVLRSRNGVTVTLDDRDGHERLVLETPGGRRVTLSDGPDAVEVVDGAGNSVTLDEAGITVVSSDKVTVRASQVAISAGLVTVDAGMARFSGAVRADTFISNTVASGAYTPGAGNIW
jgi:uncharacterized protein involved in type VI secretion and phage assembly